jgi:prepilin-type N-terminal cleavage/methylation domain-containing protein
MRIQKNIFGFTLVELLIVISILAILSTLAYMSYSQYRDTADNIKTETEMSTLQSEIELEQLKELSFPSSQL